MHSTNRKSVLLGLGAGVGLAAVAGLVMGQGASQPVKSETQYFVTGEGDDAHLWVKEGTALRCVGHGGCKAHGHDHTKGGHDHGNDAPKR